MLPSLPLSLAANAAGITDLLIDGALLAENVLDRRWHFLQRTSTLSRTAEVIQTSSNFQHTVS